MKDRTLIRFGLLNLVQGLLLGIVPYLVPSRVSSVNMLLYAAALLMLLAGPALVFTGRFGRTLAALACLFHVILGTVLAALIAGSASYLYAIYGRHGHAAGSLAFVVVIVVAIFFWLIPAHELHFLAKRRG